MASSSLQDPTSHEKIARLDRAKERFQSLLEDNREWENGCEKVFAEFRVACVHLRKDSVALDSVNEKPVVWRFLCKLSRDRKPFWGRCEEVLQILMTSDAWMKAFVEDPEMNLNDLPSNIQKEFGQRCEDVGGSPKRHIRIAIIGCGASAARHLPAIARYNERARSDFFRVAALLDVPERVAALRELPDASKLKLKDALEVSSLEDLLGKGDFDIAVVTSQVNKEQVLSQLLEKQKTLLVEPPLALSLEAANKLVKKSQEKSASQLQRFLESELEDCGYRQRLLVSEPSEYWPELQTACENVANGAVGNIFAAHGLAAGSGAEVKETQAAGIGCITAPGLCWIRALRRLLGPVEEVAAMELLSLPGSSTEEATVAKKSWLGGSRAQVGPETVATCLLRHKGGIVSSLRIQTCGPQSLCGGSQPHIVISGTSGDLVIEESGVRVNREATPSTPSNSSGYPGPRGLERAASEGGPTPTAAACSPGGSLTKKGSAIEVLDSLDKMWDLFARQAMPIAREVNPASVVLEESTSQEIHDNIGSHLQDLAVAEALGKSFLSKRFEKL
eukprot:TRINITY_DN98369_c0_g1_i1.p1 TRINITY_DN98369_c0_g1~~TRINITY_DN98369_c0_g1_i1.p1  ORF type:complete len:561 (-),score=121.23 TRINITY_DN98369_c0_g1_i1:74-1756(-)